MEKQIGRNASTKKRIDQILMTALECFNEYGYAKTTMALIRKKAKASTGSIYHHFKNKEQLAGAVYLEGIRNYQQGYVKELVRHEKAKDGIYAVVDYHLNWVEKNKQWARYLDQMRHAEFMAQNEETFRALNRDFIGHIGDWVKARLKKGELKPLLPGMFVALLMGPLQEFTRIWLAGYVETTPRQAARIIAKAAWNNLKA